MEPASPERAHLAIFSGVLRLAPIAPAPALLARLLAGRAAAAQSVDEQAAEPAAAAGGRRAQEQGCAAFPHPGRGSRSAHGSLEAWEALQRRKHRARTGRPHSCRECCPVPRLHLPAVCSRTMGAGDAGRRPGARESGTLAPACVNRAPIAPSCRRYAQEAIGGMQARVWMRRVGCLLPVLQPPSLPPCACSVAADVGQSVASCTGQRRGQGAPTEPYEAVQRHRRPAGPRPPGSVGHGPGSRCASRRCTCCSAAQAAAAAAPAACRRRCQPPA